MTQRFALCLLLAVTSRALVASGFMLALPNTVGANFPTIVVCPRQSPELAQWLTPAAHVHHHDTGQAGHEPDLSVSVLDPGCPVWSGSAVATLAAPGAFIAFFSPAAAPYSRTERRAPFAPTSVHPARAPPRPA